MERDTDFFPSSVLSSTAHYRIAAIYVVLALSAFLLNSVVLLTFLVDRRLLTAGNLFIVSIAVADWLMATVANTLGGVTNVLQPTGKTAGCVFYAWITTVLGLGVMLHHSAIAIEKCRVLSLPFNSDSSSARVLAAIALLWCFSLIWSIFPLFGWSAYVPEGANTVCSIRWYSPISATNTSYVACLFIFFFFIPLLVIIASYAISYCNVRRMVRQAENMWGANAEATLATIANSVSLAKISGMMVAGFLLAWTPYAVVSLYSAVAGPQHIPALATIVPAMFAKSSTLYNPIIYFFAYKKFRESLWRSWKKLRGRNVVRPVWRERQVKFVKNRESNKVMQINLTLNFGSSTTSTIKK